MSQKSQNSPKKKLKRVDTSIEILGLRIVGTRKKQVLNKIWLQRKEMLHIATVNPEFVMEARENELFAECLSKSLTVADGWGIVWANQILNHKFANSQIGDISSLERISGSELAMEMVEHAAANNEKVFLLGAAEGVAEKAAQYLSNLYPHLQITWYSGAQTVKVEKNEEASMTIAKINAYEPDYLLVAYGSPWQDLWIEENRPYLRVRVAMGVGGVFDEWAGLVKLPPKWIDQVGLKWLWRVIVQPWRWRRVVKVLCFGVTVVLLRLKRLF